MKNTNHHIHVTANTTILLLSLGAIAILGGCRQKAVIQEQRISLAPTSQQTSPFDVAMEFLNNLDQYHPAEVRAQITTNMQDWSRKEQASVDWFADPMFSRLPSDVKEMFGDDRLSASAFEPFDTIELQQAVWSRDVARKVSKNDVFEPHIVRALEEQVKDGTIAAGHQDDLKLAYRLFDWTIRNIQLDPEFDDIDLIGDERARERRTRDTPSFRYLPWQNLLYGHGDWLERHRVFALMARQVGINVVLLEADRGEEEPRQPWVSAVLVDKELYLFDTKLGLPLPGQGRAVFSKLTDYVAHPELVDALSRDTERYRIVKSDLNNLVAAIDATPAALSQRFKQIETKLSGDRKMVLAVAPQTLSRSLRACKHVNDVEISLIPYRAYQFSQLLGRAIQAVREDANDQIDKLGVDVAQLTALTNKQSREGMPFEDRGPIMRGRLLHLRGFDRGEFDNPGAKKLYMNSRMSKKDLQRFNIPMEKMPKDSPMIRNLPKDPVEARLVFQKNIEQARQMAILAKDLATYWLGAIAFDSNEFKVATDFFKLNVENEESEWQQSASYNLARAYEAMGTLNKDQALIEKAIELYEGDKDSPQRVGNLMRAERLEQGS